MILKEVWLADGKQGSAFLTKPQIALSLVERAQVAGIAFKAVVADCFYGDNNAPTPAKPTAAPAHCLAA